MPLQLRAWVKKLQVKIENKNYEIKNELLAEAMHYAGLIEKGQKTLKDIPDNLTALVEALIAE